MTRQELIHQMALMTDEELQQYILIFKDGGKASPYENFLKTLPDNLRSPSSTYRMERFWELNDKPKDFKEALAKDMFTLESDGYYHASSVAFNKETGDYEFMKHSKHPTYHMEIDWYNSDDPEAIQFREEYELQEDPEGFSKYVKRVKKHAEGGALENVNLDQVAQELNKEEEPEYKQIKLCKEGSVLDQLKEQLPDDEVIDLLKNFGIDELLEGGIKKGSLVSIRIVLGESSNEETKKTPETKNIEIGDKAYKVEVVSSEEDMEKGLGERESLDSDKGMLFDFGSVQEEVTFNCEEMAFPIDIVFINDDDEVIRVAENCQPGKDLFTESNVRYVLEVNVNSGILKGDELELNPDDEIPTMKVLAPDGSTQMELEGGERIFSRIKTRQLIKWAKRADKTKKDSDYKHLGKLIFDEIAAQDNRPAEYVEVPEN